MADAIADYDALVSEVKAWCARGDSTFSSRMPMFVSLAENRMYHGHGQMGDPLYSPAIRSRIMEKSADVTMTSGSGSLPADALDVRRIYRATDRTGIIYAPPAAFSVMNAASGGGSPYYYTIEGATLRVTPTMDGTLSLLYIRKFDPVTTANKAGPMIQEHGLAYFKALMFYAFAFMQDQDQAGAWLAEYRALVDGINRVSADVRNGAQRVRSTVRAIG